MATTQAAQEGGQDENDEPHKVNQHDQLPRCHMAHCLVSWLGQVLLLGDSGVGKTSIFQRFLRNTFEHKVSSTIGK
jgi:GTP-binding protein EngB required for normal cell division